DGHTELSYSNVWNALRDTDEDPENTDNVILLYTGWSVSNSGYPIWNREHTWAKSHGDFGETPPCGTDVHHLRPTDVQVNGDRGNLDFDYSDIPYPTIPGCFYDSDSWEPRDEVKGDVARMIFYMATRYEGENGELDLEVVDEVNTSPNPEHGKLSALLEWNQLDPPSEFEETRNDRIYDNWQGNRNPFVDHPEFADYIWGSGQPEIAADFYADIIVGNPPLSVQFTDTSIGENIIEWSWDLDGDGSEDSNLQNPSFIYQSAGFYTVSLTVEDDMGSTDTETKIDYIHVSSASLPVVIFSESFENLIPEWFIISLASNYDWERSDDTTNYTHPSTVPDGEWYMYANNYGADEVANDWLISPDIALTQFDDPYFHFEAWTKFSDTIAGLEVFVSSDFTGDPTTADWTIVTADLPSLNSDVWQNSGDIDLSDFNDDEVNLAFQYTSTGTGTNNTTAWAIDNLMVMGFEPSSAEEFYNIPNYGLSIYPNPFSKNSNGTQINFSIPQNSQNVHIQIYNIKGQKVKQLEMRNLKLGINEVIWDGTDMKNSKVRSGIYLINLKIDSYNVETKKCLVIN
ncbi:MAG: endonuclease, partial [Candidatus Cloacimonetes bacterium]|nr:endonuclease [Candidatus Cloacimonadota bacterium]